MSIERIHGRPPLEVKEKARNTSPPAAAVKSEPAAEYSVTAREVDDDAVKVSLRSSGARGHAYGVAKKLQRIDSNGDQILNREELETASAAREGSGKGGNLIARILQNYERLDSDHDGSLSFAEMHPRFISRAEELAAEEQAPVLTPPAEEVPVEGGDTAVTPPVVPAENVPVTEGETAPENTGIPVSAAPEVLIDAGATGAESGVVDPALVTETPPVINDQGVETLLADAASSVAAITGEIVASVETVVTGQEPEALVA